VRELLEWINGGKRSRRERSRSRESSSQFAKDSFRRDATVDYARLSEILYQSARRDLTST
jgi:hypothetical protein